MNKFEKQTNIIINISILAIFLLSIVIANININQQGKMEEELLVSSTYITTTSNNKTIGWGIKRSNNHEQPDVGNSNKELLEKYGGKCLGNKGEKVVYLTFDEGYEAGYTASILDTLKENEVKATFFITAHYVNTATDLVQRMIDEGHIVGNHTTNSLMSVNKKKNARVIAYLK